MRRAAVLAVLALMLLFVRTGTGDAVPKGPGAADDRAGAAVLPGGGGKAACADSRASEATDAVEADRAPSDARPGGAASARAPGDAAASEETWARLPGVRDLLRRDPARAVREAADVPVRAAAETLASLCALAGGGPAGGKGLLLADADCPDEGVPVAKSFKGDGTKTHWAVIVGIDNYTNPGITDLTGCVNDANAIETVLLARPEWVAGNITKLTDGAATKLAIQGAIAAVAAACDDDDLVLFYFSGHGSQVVDVAPIDEPLDGIDETILPAETNPLLDTTQIRDDELSTWLGGLPSATNQILVIIDACFAAGQGKGVVKSVPGAGVPAKGDGFAADFTRPAAKDANDVANTEVLAACNDTELSLTGAPFGYPTSLYTYHLTAGLNSGAADANTNGYFSALEAHNYAQPLVVADALTLPWSQTPQHIDNCAGDLEFLSRDDAYEENDAIGASAAISGGTYPLLFCIDDDFFSVDLTLDASLTVSINFTNANGNLDLGVYDPGQVLVAPVVDSGTDTETVVVDPTVAGTYYIRVFGHGGGDTNSYSMTVTLTVPTIVVEGNGQVIGSGDSTPESGDGTYFGRMTGAVLVRTFTIRNTGTAPLHLTGAPVTLTGPGAPDFTIVAQPATPVAAGGTSTFQISFSATVQGSRRATVTIPNNAVPNPYVFLIEGSTKLRWRADDRGGSGCSLAPGRVSAEGALGWAVPYILIAALYALLRARGGRRSSAPPRRGR